MRTRRLRAVLLGAMLASPWASVPPGTAGEDDVFGAMKANRAVPPVLAPDLEIPSVTGGSLRLSDFRGKALIVGFFVTT